MKLLSSIDRLSDLVFIFSDLLRIFRPTFSTVKKGRERIITLPPCKNTYPKDTNRGSVDIFVNATKKSVTLGAKPLKAKDNWRQAASNRNIKRSEILLRIENISKQNTQNIKSSAYILHIMRSITWSNVASRVS